MESYDWQNCHGLHYAVLIFELPIKPFSSGMNNIWVDGGRFICLIVTQRILGWIMMSGTK